MTEPTNTAFYCEECLRERGWPMSNVQTTGDCSGCGRSGGRLLYQHAEPMVETVAVDENVPAVDAPAPAVPADSAVAEPPDTPSKPAKKK